MKQKPKPKLTLAKVNYFIKDERHAVKSYKRVGLPHLARSEARHLRYLKKLQTKMKKRRK
jgi:hypothetical protein